MIPLGQVGTALEAKHAGIHVTAFRLSPRTDIAGSAVLVRPSDRLSVSYNQYTGEPMGAVEDGNSFFFRLRQFHKHFWGGAAAPPFARPGAPFDRDFRPSAVYWQSVT